jgi:DNA polymerase III epsilon subunit family exonuclease
MSLLAGARVVAVDIETTGMSPDWGHTIVEVAAVTLERGEIADVWATLVAPGRAIPADASAVHGIDDAMVADALPAAVAARELRRRCEGAMLAFHNHEFDLPFVAGWLRAAGEPPLVNPLVDTLGLARALPDVGGHGLHELAGRLGIPAETAHRAQGDALLTARVLVALVDRWTREGRARSLVELAALSQDALRAPRRDAAGLTQGP